MCITLVDYYNSFVTKWVYILMSLDYWHAGAVFYEILLYKCMLNPVHIYIG